MSTSELTPALFRQRPAVIQAVATPRSPRRVLNYMCGCDTTDPDIRKRLSLDQNVSPLMTIWLQSGTSLDDFCQPLAAVVSELKADPASLIGEEWDSVEGKVAKVLLAYQLSRSCFRGTVEAFFYDPIGRHLVRELVGPDLRDETLRLPAALVYLLLWALAHSEDLEDLDRAVESVDLSIKVYPDFKLLEERNKPTIDQHRQVLKKYGRYPERNPEFGRQRVIQLGDRIVAPLRLSCAPIQTLARSTPSKILN